MREAGQAHGIRRLDDATFLAIDRVFVQLYEREPLQYQILRDKYIQQMENREICRQLHIGRSQFDLAFACAKAFIAGAITAKEVQVWL